MILSYTIQDIGTIFSYYLFEEKLYHLVISREFYIKKRMGKFFKREYSEICLIIKCPLALFNTVESLNLSNNG